MLFPLESTESGTSGNRIKFQTRITKIDTAKGTPNFSRWSKDGKSIIYFTPLKQSGYALWQLSPVTLVPEMITSNIPSPVLDWNSKSLAYIRDQRLHIIEVATGKEKAVTLPMSTTNSKYYLISWSPNSRFLAVYIASGIVGAIWTYDSQTSSFSRLAEINNSSPIAPDPTAYIYMTAWSPKSDQIVFPIFEQKEVHYYSARLNGTKHILMRVANNMAFAEPSWTNENYILWYGYDEEKLKTAKEQDNFSEIHVYNIRSKKLMKLEIKEVLSAWYPVLSPDGRRVVFYGRENSRKSKLMLTDLKGSFLEILDERITPGQAPKWSPDSQSIIYDKLLDSRAITMGLITLQ
jgi:Tol biopolymer transport system component